MLDYSAGLPEIQLAPGDVVVEEGGATGGLWILLEGSLSVSRRGVAVNRVNRPGATVGDMSILLDAPFSATVRAETAARMRHAADGKGFLLSDPAIMMLVAAGVAERLNFVTTYLADLKNQYGDAPGLDMIPDVLARLADRQSEPAHPGSARDPDPEY